SLPRGRTELLGETDLIRLDVELEDRQRTEVALADAGSEARLARRDHLGVHAGDFLDPAPPFGKAQAGRKRFAVELHDHVTVLLSLRVNSTGSAPRSILRRCSAAAPAPPWLHAWSGAPRTDRDRSAHALCRIRELYVCQELR